MTNDISKRIFKDEREFLKIKKLDGNFITLPFPRSRCILSIKPRALFIHVLGGVGISRNGKIPEKLIADLKGFVSKGKLGALSPYQSLVIRPLNLSRGIALTHPLLPGHVIYASGVGLFTRKSRLSESLILRNPNPDMSVRQRAKDKGLGDAMSTLVLMPDGCLRRFDNIASLGTYVLGKKSDLAKNANGEETLLRKIDQTEKMTRIYKDVFVPPEIILYGSYESIKDTGWFFYTLPETISPLELFKTGQKIDKLSGGKQYLYEHGVFQLFRTLSFIHDFRHLPRIKPIPTFHGQLHVGNWKYVVDRRFANPISITDWGTSVDLTSYSRKGRGDKPSLYEEATALDFSKALLAAVSVYYPIPFDFKSILINDIAELLGYGFAGYFEKGDARLIIAHIKKEFLNVFKKKIIGHVLSGKKNLNATEEVALIIENFIQPNFYHYSSKK